jgi:hypothetical protein
MPGTIPPKERPIQKGTDSRGRFRFLYRRQFCSILGQQEAFSFTHPSTSPNGAVNGQAVWDYFTIESDAKTE